MGQKEDIQADLHRQDVIERAVEDQRSGSYNPTNGNPLVHAGFGSDQENKDYSVYNDAYAAARDHNKGK